MTTPAFRNIVPHFGRKTMDDLPEPPRIPEPVTTTFSSDLIATDNIDQSTNSFWMSSVGIRSREFVLTGILEDKKLKEHSTEEFKALSNEPTIKEIMPGLVKLEQDQVKERIKAQLGI